MQLHSYTISPYSRIRPSESDQVDGSNLEQLNRSGRRRESSAPCCGRSRQFGVLVGADRHTRLIACRQAPFRCCVGQSAESRVQSITLCSGVFAGVAAEPPAGARASSRMRKNRQVEGAPGIRIGTRRGRGGAADPAAPIACRPATASIARSVPLHTAQAAHVQPTAARRTSMDQRPQVKAARIGDPLRVGLTEHAADR
ncbi:hypothetical protein EVAR_67532_1 [Eumeta japonica]|uniref:Uncharacterized protein n=1 Tax=Eumeta variegata TaxID=151549 RepID=A0A4C2A0Q8_EUMVA|nr:hypothetical protein EVAR_67532_1 [Eumeta japonica]